MEIDIFDYDLIMVSIHMPLHWALVVVDSFQLTVTYYDSYIQEHTTDAPAYIINKYLEDEYREKKGQELGLKCTTYSDKTVQQQGNGYDCGVYVCLFAEQPARDETIAVNPADIPD